MLNFYPFIQIVKTPITKSKLQLFYLWAFVHTSAKPPQIMKNFTKSLSSRLVSFHCLNKTFALLKQVYHWNFT